MIYEEVAFIAYYFNNDVRHILEMEHWERRLWCEEISRINREINEKTTGSN
jgi:hypothetical protein